VSTLFEPIETAEISWHDNQPRSKIFDDLYFSSDNGLEEARHVFLNGNQLKSRFSSLTDCDSSIFVIAETGFGTGLNFLLTWELWCQYAPKKARLHFISCEKHPLKIDDLSRSLSLWKELQYKTKLLLDKYPVLTPGFHSLQFDEGRINLTLMLGDALLSYRELLVSGDLNLEKNIRESYVNAWFLDGFTPSKNPTIWDEALFTTIALLSDENTTLSSYSVAGVVKQGLKSAGFNVEKKLGFGQKREMLFAKFSGSALGKTYRHTPWHISKPKSINTKTAIVLGAGLAGSYVASSLAKRGWQVNLIDENETLGQGASGNRQALLYPKFSSFYSPLNAFMLSAYIYAVRTYKHLLPLGKFGVLTDLIQLAYNEKEKFSQDYLQPWLVKYPLLGAILDSEQASFLAGVKLEKGGLLIKDSFCIDSPALCEYLVQNNNINFYANSKIQAINYDGCDWHVNNHHAKILIITNGHEANKFIQTRHLPLKTIEGQMTLVEANEFSNALKIPICGEGHIIPAQKDIHAIGATYRQSSSDISHQLFNSQDDLINLARINSISENFANINNVVGQWSGKRAATPDYLPLVGQVADDNEFLHQFSGFKSNPKRWYPMPGAYQDGLYICAGFGSRGLTTIPISAEWLASMINQEPTSLPRKMIQSFSASRFLRRKILKSNYVD